MYKYKLTFEPCVLFFSKCFSLVLVVKITVIYLFFCKNALVLLQFLFLLECYNNSKSYLTYNVKIFHIIIDKFLETVVSRSSCLKFVIVLKLFRFSKKKKD